MNTPRPSLAQIELNTPRTSLSRGPSLRMKYITSSAIWFSAFVFGMSYNLIPSLLTELKVKYNTTLNDISFIFIIILIAYVIGAIICGILFNLWNRQLCLIILMYVLAICVILIPFTPTMTLIFVIGGFHGFTNGGIEPAQIVWILELWKGQAGIFLHAHYFFFAVGSAVAPLLLSSFLLEENLHKNITMSEDNVTSTTMSTMDLLEPPPTSQSYIPMSIAGFLIIASASYLLFLYFYDKYEPEVEIVAVQDKPRKKSLVPVDLRRKSLESVDMESRWTANRIILVILGAMVLSGYQGMEIAAVQFMPTFAHEIKLKLPEPRAALVASALTGSFTGGRLIGILVVYFKLAPTYLLIANLVLSFIGNILLYLFANENEYMLWTGAVLLGIGFSTIFACVYDYLEKYLKVSNTVGTIFIVAGGAVALVYLIVIGQYLNTQPFVIVYLVFCSATICTIGFGLIYYITSIRSKRMELDIPVNDTL